MVNEKKTETIACLFTRISPKSGKLKGKTENISRNIDKILYGTENSN